MDLEPEMSFFELWVKLLSEPKKTLPDWPPFLKKKKFFKVFDWWKYCSSGFFRVVQTKKFLT